MNLSSEVLDQIRSTHTRLSSDLKEGEEIEIEARFGFFSNSSFRSGVSRQTFIRVRDLGIQLDPGYSYTHSKDKTFQEIDESIRERYTTDIDSEGLPSNQYRLIKTRIQNIDFYEYFLRISIAKEIVDEVPEPEAQPIYIREKKRWSFRMVNDQYRLDLTEVTSYSPQSEDPRQAETVYEIEVEIQEPLLNGLPQFDQVIGAILQQVLDTQILYTQNEKTGVISRINTYLGSQINSPYQIDHHVLNQARNLKARDLVHGGIVPSGDHSVYYSVTPKADGQRKLLVFDTDGIYLVIPPNNINKIFDQNLAQKLSGWAGTVIETEALNPKDLSVHADPDDRNAQIYLLMYDVLSVTGDSAVRNKSHPDRMKYIRQAARIFEQVPNVKIIEKQFFPFKDRLQFYAHVNAVLNHPWPFNTDGLVFTPENYQYDTDLFGTRTIDERSLKKYPDIVKWKPPHLLTIDFEIEHMASEDGNYVDLRTNRGSFMGTTRNPFDPKINVHRTDELNRTSTGTIGEFQWDPEAEQFTLLKIREFKDKPNSEKVAIDIWKDIHSPIDEELIRGHTFGLVNRYHNRVKRELFQEVGRSLPKVDGTRVTSRTLLDIGSGRGGDVDKWEAAGFTHVICVEPDEENRLELINRLGNTHLIYNVIPTIGQDLETIVSEVRRVAPNKAVEAISCMLSLSFFFDSPESSSALIELINNTLMHGGYFLSLTIDGRHVLKLFDTPQLYQMENDIRKANFTMIDFELHPTTDGKPVYINIPNSIVKNQRESLTNIPGLIQELNQRGLVKVREEQLMHENFMTDEEQVFTKLFTSFVLKRHS